MVFMVIAIQIIQEKNRSNKEELHSNFHISLIEEIFQWFSPLFRCKTDNKQKY